jgi:broad specificity phosphatase PhoE
MSSVAVLPVGFLILTQLLGTMSAITTKSVGRMKAGMTMDLRTRLTGSPRCMSHSVARTQKTFIFVRHGLTEMNERLQAMPWYSDNFVDGALWDTRLSSTGVQQAKDKHQQLVDGVFGDINLNDVEVLLASPLTRTLHTAELVFNARSDLLPEVPKIAHPLLRERLYLSSEVGRCSSELQKEFPGWDFSAVAPGHAWWFVHPGCVDASCETPPRGDTAGSGTGHTMVTSPAASLAPTPPHIHTRTAERMRQLHSSEHAPYVEWRPEGQYCCEGEPKEVFAQRVAELREYLLSRPEHCLAVVTHWGILKALTGREFHNCEMQVVKAAELLPTPDVSDE